MNGPTGWMTLVYRAAVALAGPPDGDEAEARCAVPRTAARLLFEHLRLAGLDIFYHGDFDWPGIRIANVIMRRHGARPWRFDAADYRQTAGRASLSGDPVSPSWSRALGDAMMEAGRAVHEEAVLEKLLDDLRVR